MSLLYHAPKICFKKHQTHSSGAFCIVKKIGANAYDINLPCNLKIKLILNNENSLPYQEKFESSSSISFPKVVPVLPKGEELTKFLFQPNQLFFTIKTEQTKPIRN